MKHTKKNKDSFLTIRLASQDLERLQDLADKADRTVSDFARHNLLKLGDEELSVLTYIKY
jgi:predicted transcriptional regulator